MSSCFLYYGTDNIDRCTHKRYKRLKPDHTVQIVANSVTDRHVTKLISHSFQDKKKKYEPPIPTRVGKKKKRLKGPDAANKLPLGKPFH
jgi:hypothetical protein